MKTIHLCIAIVLLIFVASCNKTTESEKGKPYIALKDSAEMVEYGKYLVTITGCNDCHTPKKMGPKGPELIHELLLSGYQSNRPIASFDKEKAMRGFAQMNEDMTAAAGPWGISFAANLTPHETGIGSWNLDQFKIALKQGKSKGMENGRMLLPPMPWFNYAEMKDEDVRAIYEYLKSLKPIENTVPASISFKN